MLRLVFTGKYFICRSHFSERNIPRAAGFRWSEKRKAWYTDSVRDAFKLRKFADSSAEAQFARRSIVYSPWFDRVPSPKTQTPKPFQIDATYFALDRNHSYLGLDPGMGKAVIAVLISNALEVPTVLICPPTLTRNAEAEFRTWTTWTNRIARLEPSGPALANVDVMIVPDSILNRAETEEAILSMSALAHSRGGEALLLIDEAHRYKTETTQRSKALLGYDEGGEEYAGFIDSFERQVFLSGTPSPNGRPIELFPILTKSAPDTIDFMTRVEYGMKFCAGKLVEETCPRCYGSHGRSCRYCGGRGKFENGYDFNGASNLGEFKGRVYGNFLLRLRKKDHLKELPPKTEELVILGERPAKLIQMESKILREHSPEDLVAGSVSSDHISTYRKELGAMKVRPAVDFIKSILEDNSESLLVFAYHKDVIAALVKRLAKYDPIVITGKTPKAERHALVKTFQKDKSRRLFIGNYIAAGLGLTLTKATQVFFVEFSFVPAENDQASDRAHRIGQLDNVFVRYGIYENSIDQKVMEINFRKRKITNFL